ncbi:MAG: TetR/AcrR family transcriptional regulator [Microbacteriaceae bacterium]
MNATTSAITSRERAKAHRREALLSAAAHLFAERGFNGVTIEELGAAAGVSGPAVYRHFDGKQAVLAALLIGVSERLHTGGLAVVERAAAGQTLPELVRFHSEFALANPNVIRVQDRDLDSLNRADRHTVRALQRRYVELWVRVLVELNRQTDPAVLRTRAHAVFGLLNSTPHSDQSLPGETVRQELERMALAALAW